jgi:hypothetical protein
MVGLFFLPQLLFIQCSMIFLTSLEVLRFFAFNDSHANTFVVAESL